ncbi:hypothetical protein ABKV19_022408 [Rosa sericea]
MIAQFSDFVVFRLFSTLFAEEEISPMRNSGCSSTVPERAESDSDLICSSKDDDEVGALEDIGLHKPVGFDEEDDDVMEQIRELEELCRTDHQNSKGSKPKGEEKLTDDYNGSEDSDTLDALWEHQELIKQLKMELKKVRATTGLPTILEESESLDMDDLKA